MPVFGGGWGGGASGSAVPSWVSYLTERQTGETVNSDDDFFTTDSSADYTTQTVSGTATWTIQYGLLSVVADDQTLGDVSAYLKALTSPSAPTTISTSVQLLSPEIGAAEFSSAGILFTDGTATTSNAFFVGLEMIGGTSDAQVTERRGTLTDSQGDGSTAITGDLFIGISSWSRVHLRAIWSAANTFEMAMSLDGVTWTDRGATTFAQTMTPTHAGFAVSTQGGNDEFLASFDYLRVDASDLSV